MKNTSNRDLFDRLKTKAVVELEAVIKDLQQSLSTVIAERDSLVEYRALVEGENQERVRETEKWISEVIKERGEKVEAEVRAKEVEERIKEMGIEVEIM